MNAQKILFSFGLLAITFSGEAQVWNEVSTPSQERLNDIQFVDEQNGFIVGENGTFLKTTNGGSSWDLPLIQGIPNQSTSNFLEIEMLDASNGFLTIENNFNIFQTTDGGVNWTAVVNNNTNQCFPTSLHVNTINDLFVGGSDCFQGATINRVQTGTWSNQTVNYETFDTQHLVIDIDFEGSLGLAAVNNEYFLRTTDSGVTWDSINSNIGNGNVLTSVMIASNDTCYAGYNQNGGGFGILYSTDDGITWQEDINSATFYYPAYYGGTENNSGTPYITAVPSNSAIGLIFEKTGTSWFFHQVDHPVYAMDSYGDDVTWAVGDSGYVVVNKDLSMVSIQEYQDDVNALTVFPNPTKNAINWSCASCEVEEIRVLNLAGQEVLINASNTPTSIDLYNLPSGVYILELQSSKGVRSTRIVKE